MPRTRHHSTSPTTRCSVRLISPLRRRSHPRPPTPPPHPTARPAGPSRAAGIYILQIRHVDPGATPVTNQNRSGLNRYSVQANGTGAKLFALGDFSIYNNASGTTTSFYLAEVPTYYHGKTFVVELYDAGESAANGTLAVVDPSGTPFNDGECRIYSRNNPSVAWGLQQTINAGSNCQETVTPRGVQRAVAQVRDGPARDLLLLHLLVADELRLSDGGERHHHLAGLHDREPDPPRRLDRRTRSVTPP